MAVLPSEHYLQGDPDTGYIQIGHPVRGDLGLWILDRAGLRRALGDRDMQPVDSAAEEHSR
jgi:hypothetical protein